MNTSLETMSLTEVCTMPMMPIWHDKNCNNNKNLIKMIKMIKIWHD